MIGQAQMTGDFAVDLQGMVNFPILGKIKASQHTTLELERKITTLLADGQILKRPLVTVSVGEYGSQRVFVTGEVQKPGRYPLKADRSLLALLGDIGPLGQDVGHEVIVVRPPASAGGASGPAMPLSMTDPPRPRARTPRRAVRIRRLERAGACAEPGPGPALRRAGLGGVPDQPARAAVGEPREEHRAQCRRHRLFSEGLAGVRDGQRRAPWTDTATRKG